MNGFATRQVSDAGRYDFLYGVWINQREAFICRQFSFKIGRFSRGDMTAERTVFDVLKLIAVSISLLSVTTALVSRIKTKQSREKIAFVAAFLLICSLSAILSVNEYKGEIVRRDTWVRAIAKVTKQEGRGRNGDCDIDYTFIATNPQTHISSQIKNQDTLESRDDCDQYRVGTYVTVHYPNQDPNMSRTFLHQYDTNAQRIIKWILDSVFLDIFLGFFLLVGWVGLGKLYRMIFL